MVEVREKKKKWVMSKGRGVLYSFFSSVFKDEVSLEHIDVFLSAENRLLLEELLNTLPEENRHRMEEQVKVIKSYQSSGISGEQREEINLGLRKEFAFLFLTPHGVYPFESIYRGKKKLLMDRPWEEVRGFYRSVGLEKDKSEMHPEDHIAVELGFMATFAFLTSSAGENESAEEGTEDLPGLLQVQQSFLQEHLLKWIPDFCNDMEQKSRNDFYRAVAALTREFVWADSAALEEVMIDHQ